jgi:hypothetical protein
MRIADNRFCSVILRAWRVVIQQDTQMPDAPCAAASRIRVAIIGSGPAGLAAAEMLMGEAEVHVFDAMAAPGRKFLLAGRGGLNLTHGEEFEKFLGRFGAARAMLEPALRAFPPEAIRQWAAGLGTETFVGSSGRVFPTAMKASPLLRAWLARLVAAGVQLHMRHRWQGWNEEGGTAFRHAGWRARIRQRGIGAGTRRRELAAPGQRWCVDRTAGGAGGEGQCTASGQLRFRCGLECASARALCRTACEVRGDSASVRGSCVVNSSLPPTGSRAVRSMHCQRRCAMQSRRRARPP